MPHISHHPAPGFGDLMDGWFVVPQNPLRPGDIGTPLVPSLQATAPGRTLRRGRLAELMPGQFTVPQNPLRQALGGLGCGSSGGCGNSNYTLNGLSGLGLDTSGITDFFTSDTTGQALGVSGIPNWAFLAAGTAIAWMIFMPSGSEYREKRAKLRADYAGYRRLTKSAGKGLSSV